MYQFEKLFDVLTEAEQQAFGQWLAAHSSDRQQPMQEMYRHWRAGVSWEDMPARLDLKPHKAANRLNHLRSELQEHIENFLAQQALNRSPYTRDDLLLYELVHRRAQQAYPSVANKVAKRRRNLDIRDAEHYWYAYLQASHAHGMETLFPPRYRKPGPSPRLFERMDAWCHYVHLRTAELLLELVATTPTATTPPPPLLQALFDAGLSRPEAEQPAAFAMIRVLHDLYQRQAWTEPTDAEDRRRMEQLHALRPIFSPPTFANLHLLYFNFLVRKNYYTPEPTIPGLLLEMAEWSLAHQIWPMNRPTYRNLSSLMAHGLSSGAYAGKADMYVAQARRLLEKFQDALPSEERKAAYLLNMVQLDFALGRYESVQVNLAQHPQVDPYYEVSHRVLVIQAQVETGDTLHTPDAIHSLIQRVRQARIFPPIQQKAYLNRLRILQKLLKAKGPRQLLALQEALSQTHPLSGRAWLERKLKERLESGPSR